MLRTKRTVKKEFDIASLHDDDVCAICPGKTPAQLVGLVYGLCWDHITNVLKEPKQKYRMQRSILIEQWGLLFEKEQIKLPESIARDWLDFDWIKKESWIKSLFA